MIILSVTQRGMFVAVAFWKSLSNFQRFLSLYSPELKLGFTPCCLPDHVPFHEKGFPATLLFECAGSIADPAYHDTGDVNNHESFDFGQLRSVTKVQLAALLHATGYKIEPEDR